MRLDDGSPTIALRDVRRSDALRSVALWLDDGSPTVSAILAFRSVAAARDGRRHRPVSDARDKVSRAGLGGGIAAARWHLPALAGDGERACR